MAPLGTRTPTKAIFDATYRDVDLARFGDTLALRGHPLHRPRDRAQPHGVAARPVLGRAARRRRRSRCSRPRGNWCSAASPPSELTSEEERLGKSGDRSQRGSRWPTSRSVRSSRTPSIPSRSRSGPAGSRRARPTSSSRAAPRGATQSTIPFHVTSADWQESDRLLAGIMTAFGSDTGRRRRRRLGRVRRRDDEGVPRAARRGPLHRRAHARLGRRVGRRLRRHRHRERLRDGRELRHPERRRR